jgi:hypothetical protein
MQPSLKVRFLRQIDDVLGLQTAMQERTKYPNLAGLSSWDYEQFNTAGLAAIERITGTDSAYFKQATAAIKAPQPPRPDYLAPFCKVRSSLQALRDAVAADHLETASGLIHAAVFADFLEMAQHLLDEGYKDAAAVIAGSALEAHLRQLCVNASIDTTVTNSNSGDIVPKKADRMNADLCGAKVYPVLDQKNATAWLDLRNKAAHGEYDKYVTQQVAIMISGIRDFITRVPA